MTEKIIKVKFIEKHELLKEDFRSGYLFEYQDKKESFFIQAKDTNFDKVQVNIINQLVNLSQEGYTFKWIK